MEYKAELEIRCDPDRVFDSVQTVLTSHGFEIAERTENALAARLRLRDARKDGSSLQAFSEIRFGRQGRRIAVSARYGNLHRSAIIVFLLSAAVTAIVAYMFWSLPPISKSDYSLLIRLIIFLPLVRILVIPLAYRRARRELDKLVRSLEKV